MTRDDPTVDDPTVQVQSIAGFFVQQLHLCCAWPQSRQTHTQRLAAGRPYARIELIDTQAREDVGKIRFERVNGRRRRGLIAEIGLLYPILFAIALPNMRLRWTLESLDFSRGRMSIFWFDYLNN